MKKIFITYANGQFTKKMPFVLKTAKYLGGFDQTIGYKLCDIDEEFFKNNENILTKDKGAGYWLWKPYFIHKTLETMDEGDILFYGDVGSFFCRSIENILDDLLKYNQSVMAFGLPLIELQWTNKQLFRVMNCDKEDFKYSNQLNGSFHLIIKNKESLDFYKKFLGLACVESNITGINNSECTQDQYFIEHRYDQSIFSLLYKKSCYSIFKDPTQYSSFEEGYTGFNLKKFNEHGLYSSENNRLCKKVEYKQKYKNVIFHNRNNNPLVSILKFKLKLYWLKLKNK